MLRLLIIMVTAAQVVSSVADAWRITEPMLPSEWADANRVLLERSSAESGRWATDRTPYLRLPMDAAADSRVRHITIIKAEQCGGTEALINILAWKIDNRPGPTMWSWPSIDVARKSNKRRLLPALHAIPAASRHFTGRAHDESASVISLDSMDLYFAGAGSQANIESIPCDMVLADELDRAEEQQPNIADILIGRIKTFRHGKMIDAGTPGLAEVGIDAQWRRSQQLIYVVPCPHCGQYHARDEFAQVKWPTEEGQHPMSVAPGVVERHAWFECPRCGEAIRAARNHWQLLHGMWISPGDGERVVVDPDAVMTTERCASRLSWDDARDPEITREYGFRIEDAVSLGGGGGGGGHVGFWIGGLYNALVSNPYGEVARPFVESVRSGGSPSKNWVQRKMGQAWQPRGDTLEASALRTRCTSVASGGLRMQQVPEHAVAITQAFDVQQDCLWHGVRWWAEPGHDDGETGLLLYERIARIEGDKLVTADAAAMRRWTWRDQTQTCALTLIDHGHYSDEVEAMARRLIEGGLRNVILVKGVWSAQMQDLYQWTHFAQSVDQRGHRIAGTGLRALRIKVDEWKTHVLGRARGERFVLPENTPDEYLEQLTAEHCRRTQLRGRIEHRWEKKPGRRDNHAFDVEVYQHAAADAVGLQRWPLPEPVQARPEPKATRPSDPLLQRSRESRGLLDRRRT